MLIRVLAVIARKNVNNSLNLNSTLSLTPTWHGHMTRSTAKLTTLVPPAATMATRLLFLMSLVRAPSFPISYLLTRTLQLLILLSLASHPPMNTYAQPLCAKVSSHLHRPGQLLASPSKHLNFSVLHTSAALNSPNKHSSKHSPISTLSSTESICHANFQLHLTYIYLSLASSIAVLRWRWAAIPETGGYGTPALVVCTS